MTTETFEIESQDGSKTFLVEVSFSVEPTEYEGPYMFYAGGYDADEWRALDASKQEILHGSYVGQKTGESVEDFILRYADENAEGSPPIARYPLCK